MKPNQDIPRDNPTFEILSNGNAVQDFYDILSIGVHREANRIASARITLFDGGSMVDGFEASDGDDFVPGAEIEILAGYDSENARIFKGIVVRQCIKRKAGRFELVVDCKHPAMRLALMENSKYFYDMPDSEIFDELVRPYGIALKGEETKAMHPEMVQFQVSDWEFLVRRAELNGQLVFTQDDGITITAPELNETSEQTIDSDAIMEIEMEMEARSQMKAVSASAWDQGAQSVISTEAVAPKMEEQGNIKADQLATIAMAEEHTMFHPGPLKDAELQSWADSKLLKSRLSKIRGRIKIQGEASVQPGNLIGLEGIGKRFDGPIYITGVRHQINSSNWETDIQCGLSPEWFTKTMDIDGSHSLVPPAPGLQTGVVVALAGDPEGEDRILVRTPLLKDNETGIWARVNCLDAGANRGAFFRPEIDDEVLLGFLHNDPRYPVVMGMLNSCAKPAPFKTSDENPEKGFVTRSGIKFLFDDDLDQISMETSSGNLVKISGDSKGVSIRDENENKLELNPEGITIESAGDIVLSAQGDVKIKGINIEEEASVEYKAKGATSAEFSSDGITVLKGSLVNIN